MTTKKTIKQQIQQKHSKMIKHLKRNIKTSKLVLNSGALFNKSWISKLKISGINKTNIEESSILEQNVLQNNFITKQQLGDKEYNSLYPTQIVTLKGWTKKRKSLLNSQECGAQTIKNSAIKPIKQIITAQRLDQYIRTAQKGAVGKGIKLILKGRLNSSGIASKQIFGLGSVPKQTLDTPIREKNVAIRTVKGLIGLKIITG